PSRIFFASLAAASLSLAYLVATSLYAGPTSFLSTAWHARQFFALARSALANALAETIDRPAAAMSSTFFIQRSVLSGKVGFPKHSNGRVCGVLTVPLAVGIARPRDYR